MERSQVRRAQESTSFPSHKYLPFEYGSRVNFPTQLVSDQARLIGGTIDDSFASATAASSLFTMRSAKCSTRESCVTITTTRPRGWASSVIIRLTQSTRGADADAREPLGTHNPLEDAA